MYDIISLGSKELSEIQVIAKQFNIPRVEKLEKQDLIYKILDHQALNPTPEILSKEFLQRLNGDLHLTKEQHEAIQKIIDEGQNSVRKAVQDARLEIREVLIPEQRMQFDELVKRPFHKPIFGTNAPAVVPPTNAAPLAPTSAP